MPDPSNQKFQAERRLGYDAILKLTQSHIDSLQPKIIIDIHALSPTAMQNSAEKEVWQLLHNGISHLKEGAPLAECGSMSRALSKASLRSGALASALGVLPPEFEPIILPANYTSGQEAAAFLADWLLHAAKDDLTRSRDAIEQKIVSEDMHAAFGFFDKTDAGVKNAMEQIQKNLDIAKKTEPLDIVSIKDIGDFRRQLIMSFNMAVAAYPACCDRLMQDIKTMPPAPPGKDPGQGRRPQGGTFSL